MPRPVARANDTLRLVQPTQNCIAASLAALLRSQPDSPGRTGLAWRAVAGAAMARATEARLDANGSLFVRSTDPHWHREVDRGRAVLLSRMQELLGARTVKDIRVD